MQSHIDQALHNEVLLDELNKSHPKYFLDWKITIMFYIALHYLEALATKKKIDLGSSHESRNREIHPKHGKMSLGRDAYTAYKRLYDYSQNARYLAPSIVASTAPSVTILAFMSLTSTVSTSSLLSAREEFWEGDYEESVKHLLYLKKYFKGLGLPISGV